MKTATILIERNSPLWMFLNEELRGLISDGEILLSQASPHNGVSDYSHLVFPIAKAYEGFLKQLLMHLDLIKEDEFYGERIRIGKLLNPHYIEANGSVFEKLCSKDRAGEDLSHRLWRVWKKGRNQVFHYFPHNFRKLSYNESIEIIHEIVSVMEEAVDGCSLYK